MAERITTRTAAQIRSHAQKYFKKINGDEDAASSEHVYSQQPLAGGCSASSACADDCELEGLASVAAASSHLDDDECGTKRKRACASRARSRVFVVVGRIFVLRARAHA